MKSRTEIKDRLDILEHILNKGLYKTNIDKIKIDVGIKTIKWVLR